MSSLRLEGEAALVLPKFLSSDFYIDRYTNVTAEMLYAGLLSPNNRQVTYISIYKTPHYHFVKNAISGEAANPISSYESYKDYSDHNPHACSEEQFIQLIEDMRSNGYDWQSRPILVFRHWSRPLPLGRWDVADGFHRLAVLAALGEKKIKVCTLHYKHTIIERLKRRLCYQNE